MLDLDAIFNPEAVLLPTRAVGLCGGGEPIPVAVVTPVVAFAVVDPFAGWIEYHRPDGGLVMVHPDYQDDCQTETEWRDEPTRKVLKGGCPRCRSDKIIDVAIHGGQSVRRDCGHCGRTVGFPVWYGTPSAN